MGSGLLVLSVKSVETCEKKKKRGDVSSCFSDQRCAQSFPSASGSLCIAVGDISVLRGQRSLPVAGFDGRSGRGRRSTHL